MAAKKLVALITSLCLISGFSIPAPQLDEETWITKPFWHYLFKQTTSPLLRKAPFEWLPPDAISYNSDTDAPIPRPYEKFPPGGASFQRPLPKLAPVPDGYMNVPRQPQKSAPVPDGYMNVLRQPQKLGPVPDGYMNVPQQPQKLAPVPNSFMNNPRQPPKSAPVPIYGYRNIPGQPPKFEKDAANYHPLSNFNQIGAVDHPLLNSNQGAPVDRPMSKFDQDILEKLPFGMKYNDEIPISTLPPKAKSDLPNDPTRFFLGRNQNFNVRPNLGNRGRPVQSRKVIYEGQTQSWEGNLFEFR